MLKRNLKLCSPSREASSYTRKQNGRGRAVRNAWSRVIEKTKMKKLANVLRKQNLKRRDLWEMLLPQKKQKKKRRRRDLWEMRCKCWCFNKHAYPLYSDTFHNLGPSLISCLLSPFIPFLFSSTKPNRHQQETKKEKKKKFHQLDISVIPHYIPLPRLVPSYSSLSLSLSLSFFQTFLHAHHHQNHCL